MWTGVLLLSLVAAASSAPVAQPPASVECDTWQACRDEAEAALAGESFERALDLAWRAAQRGPKDDPALMFLLARAQSRAGRPQDALVMVRRLAERGVRTDAITHPDLERMRNLPGWAEVEAAVSRASAGDPAAPSPPAATPPKAEPPDARAASGAPAPAPAAPAAAQPKASSTRAAAASGSAAAAAGAPMVELANVPEEVLRFTTDRFVPAGLAYDAVSRRFVMGDRYGRKLRVVGEGLDHAVDLVRAESAGFLDVRALAIDTRRGDLWVATAEADGAQGTLHRLQLISGRPLQSLPLPAEPAGQPVQPADLAVTDAGVVYVLDRGGRVLRARPGAAAVEVALQLPTTDASSLALGAGETILYAAHAGGLLRVELNTRATTEVASAELPLDAIERVRAHRDGFVALQRGPDGVRRLLRLQLNRTGRAVRNVTAYDVRVETASTSTAMAVSGDEVSLVSSGPQPTVDAAAPPAPLGPPAELVVRRFRLR